MGAVSEQLSQLVRLVRLVRLVWKARWPGYGLQMRVQVQVQVQVRVGRLRVRVRVRVRDPVPGAAAGSRLPLRAPFWSSIRVPAGSKLNAGRWILSAGLAHPAPTNDGPTTRALRSGE